MSINSILEQQFFDYPKFWSNSLFLSILESCREKMEEILTCSSRDHVIESDMTFDDVIEVKIILDDVIEGKMQ